MHAFQENSEAIMVRIDALRKGIDILQEGVLAALRDRADRCERRFQYVAERISMMLWTADLEGMLTFVSRAWLDFRRCEDAQELGAGWLDAVHEQDRNRVSHEYRSAIENRKHFLLEYRVQVGAGEFRSVINSGCPFYQADGSLGGFIGWMKEIRTGDAHLLRSDRRIAFTPLTGREREVLVRIADGYSTKEIAKALGISYKTADSHRTNIMEKLDIHDTATLVRYAIRAGLIEP